MYCSYFYSEASSENWIFEIDRRFRKFCQSALSAVFDKMVDMSRKADPPRGLDAWGLIFRNLDNRKRGSNR